MVHAVTDKFIDFVTDHLASDNFNGDLTKHLSRRGEDRLDVIVFIILVLTDERGIVIIGGLRYQVAVLVAVAKVARPPLGVPLLGREHVLCGGPDVICGSWRRAIGSRACRPWIFSI
jgi:hypothetical protein